MNQENIIYFWKPNQANGWLGNWFSSPFTVDGKNFVNSEHYFMWKKILMFQPELEDTILKMTNPKDMKYLGGKVKNYDDVIWGSARYGIMKAAVTEKFKQSPELKAQLLSTGNAILVEASPYDRIWGIGMNAQQARNSKDGFLGQNLLGKVLMEVRDELKIDCCGTKVLSSIIDRMNPPWYTIDEIDLKTYIKCLESLYLVLENKNESKSSTDIFIKSILVHHKQMVANQWETAESVRLTQKALEGKMGDFHEELMGKFPGYETLPVGHVSGCDVRKLDDTEYFEVKNRDNTMNSSAAKTVVEKLIKKAGEGKLAVLVEVNCTNDRVTRFGAPESVKVWNGRQAYKHFSGSETFFDRLIVTMCGTFDRFKTYKELTDLLTAPALPVVPTVPAVPVVPAVPAVPVAPKRSFKVKSGTAVSASP